MLFLPRFGEHSGHPWCLENPAPRLPFARPLNQGVFIEKGPFFHGKGASRTPQIPPPPGPSRKGVLLKSHWGGGLPKKVGGRGQKGGGFWNLGSARGPFTVKKRPLFEEKRLNREQKKPFSQAVLHGVPPTGLQVLS